MTAALLLSGAFASIYPGFGTFVAILVMLAAVGSALLGIVRSLSALIRRQLDQSVNYIINAILIVLLIIPCIGAGDYIHLALFYPYYATMISKNESKTVPVKFIWGDSALFVTDGMQLHTLIYDPSGASNKFVGQSPGGSMSGRVSTRHLIGPFFVEDESSD
jgi:hypothetical protein